MIKILWLAFVLFYSLFVNNVSADIYVPPIREDTVGGLLGDIDCRMWAPKNVGFTWKTYRGKDKVNWAHEGTHSVNSRIRNLNKVDNGYYLLYGDAISLKHPKFKLKDIAKSVPKDKRCSLYKLYIVKQQRSWNNEPLYVLDELVAYTNGAVIGVEYIDDPKVKRRAVESYTKAVKMYFFADIAYDLCKEEDYEDLEKFKELLAIIRKRLAIIEKAIKKQ